MSEIIDRDYLVQVLISEVRSLRARLDSALEEITVLKERLSRYEHPKDSHNSHLPSSKNPIGKKGVNLRQPTGRTSGGQKGHRGKTLEMQVADKIEELSPGYCTCCGKDLSGIVGEVIERRQQIEIPPIHPVITQYHTIRKICSCSHCNEGIFPPGVTSSVGYGPGVQSLVSYLNICQHIPYKRQIVLLKEVFGLSLSQGTIRNILHRIEQRSYSAYEVIRKMLSQSPVVGVDETGTSVNGKTRWAWVWQNALLTYVTAGHSRKKEVFTQVMPQGMPGSVLVTDCYSGYFSQGVANHQICTTHLLRDLIYLSELYDKHPWVEKMTELIRNAIHLRKTTKGVIEDKSIQERLRKLLEEVITKGYEKIRTLQKRLIKYRDYLFYFLSDENVPPDNNASERAFRVFKIKLKVSGFFKSEQGAQRFAQLHSIADTARKNEQSPVMAFHSAILNF